MKFQSCSEWLYFHLWRVNSKTGTSCPGIILTDTIIYRWAQPFYWYYTDEDGQIIRQSNKNISNSKILH